MTHRQRDQKVWTTVGLILIGLCLGISLPVIAQAQGLPVIDLWHGRTQWFGEKGCPQPFVNILGRVSDPDGIASLKYSLNGAPDSALTVGPDSRRLQSTGDFNIDIHVSNLNDGVNKVVIKARDKNANVAVDTVTVNYVAGTEWPLPYSINWSSVSDVQRVAQVTDGDWDIASDRVRTTKPGYDRLIAIGDTSWTDYEVTVPVIIHNYNTTGDIGLLLRWNGHTDDPVSGLQPKSGWFPLGCIMRCNKSGMDIYGNDGSTIATSTKILTKGVEYIFKARVETLSGNRPRYRFKAWAAGSPEPATWDMSATEASTDPQSGSFMLFAHEGDASFGNIQVASLIISNVQAVPSQNSAVVTWTTSMAANSRVDYGLTTAYELGNVSKSPLVTSHSVSLTGLASNTLYHYRAVSVTPEGDSARSGDSSFTTTLPDLSGIVSDDFSAPTLNSSLWTFINPLGDATLTLVGTNTTNAWARMSVPAGTEHSIRSTGNTIPRLMQSCNNTNFEVQAKFESAMTLQYQLQGIIVQQDNNNLIRFDFRSNGEENKIYVASYVNLVATTRINADIISGVPLYVRVKREGNTWTLRYSHDAQTWTTLVTFSHIMTVTAVGPFVGNSSYSTSPAHTANVDYFFSTTYPIVPEDGVVPTITSTPVTAGTIDVPYTYNVDAAGYPTAAYALITAPPAMTISSSTGIINWTPPIGGVFNVAVEASNVVGADSQSFAITVVAVPPEISSVPVTHATAGHPYLYDVNAIGGPSPTWTLPIAPPGMAINSVTGVISWTPSAVDSVNVMVVATNTEGADSQSFAIGVVNPAPPDLYVWYGLHQKVGQSGNSQPFVDVLGNVYDIDTVASLTYSLNDGPTMALSIGPDGRRLESLGDFNAEIARTELFDGVNKVIIKAVDKLGYQSVDTVGIEYEAGNVRPLPYYIDWSSVTNVQDVVLVSDGLWELTGSGLRTVIPGYDRIVAIGDTTWQDYEVTVPITMHSITSTSGIGLLMRWNGHTDDPVAGWQPKSGWLPLGAICRYKDGAIQIYGNDGSVIDQKNSTLTVEVPYMFKVRVETVPGVGGLYKFKVWRAGLPEPPAWDLTGQEDISDPQHGSFLFFAHRGDVSYGDVSVVSLFIDSVQNTVTDSSATITWVTNRPATSSVAYGETDLYEFGSVSDGALVTTHSVTLYGLEPNTLHHFQVTSVDGSGSGASSGDLDLKTAGPSGIVSDDFNDTILNSSVWTFVDPLGDATMQLTGAFTQNARVSMSIPGGTTHSAWTGYYTCPRLIQPANDANFQIEVKFESDVDKKYELQGIVVEQDVNNLIRFDIHYDGSYTKVFSATLTDLVPTTRISSNVTGVQPWYLRVKRESNQWTMFHSHDGQAWTEAGTFNHAMTVTAVGTFVGNSSGTSSPSHTAIVDYFFETGSPIVPEDGQIPQITTSPDTSLTKGQLYTYDVNAIGNPTPTYALSSSPAGMTINATTGLVQWTPAATGLFNVTVQAINNKGVDSQSFAISVVEAPTIISAAVTEAIVDLAYTYDVNATGRPVPTYHLTALPIGMTIDTLTGVIGWTPDSAGNFSVVVEARNTQGIAVQNFTVNVIGIAPTITSTPVTGAIVGQVYTYNCEATGAPAPRYALTTFPPGMTIDSLTGEVLWTPTSPVDVTVTLEATNTSGTASQMYFINVEEIPTITTAPDIGGIVGLLYSFDADATGTPTPVYRLAAFPAGMAIDSLSGLVQWTPSAIGDFDVIVVAANSAGSDSLIFSIHVTEIPIIVSSPITDGIVGQAYSYDVEATGTPMPTFALTQSPAGMHIDTVSGEISWTPVSAGDFDVLVIAHNSAGTDSQSFNIHVNEAPTITSAAVSGGTVGQAYVYNVTATGAPAPTYNLLVYPEGMAIDSVTGEITWLPTINGDYAVSVTSINVVASDTQSFNIHVSEIPTIVTVAPLDGVTGVLYSYDVNASGDPLPTFVLSTFPTGMTIDAASGQIEWTPTAPGDFEVTVEAVNSAGTDVQDFTLNVGVVPTITSTPTTSEMIGQPYAYDVEASGVPAPQYDLTASPPGMTIDSLSGLIEWNPDSVGDFEISLTATNKAGQDSQNFTLTIEGERPTVTSTPVSVATAGQLYVYDVDATGPPDPIFALLISPSGMTINPTSGEIQWLPTAPGTYDITVEATNAAGTELHVFSLRVNEIPAIISTAVTGGIVGLPYTYNVQASGDPAPVFTLTNSPETMTIDSTSGQINWTPTSTGYFDVVLRASNVAGADSQSYAVHVTRMPGISSEPTTTGTVGLPYTYDVNATGDPTPFYVLATFPQSMTIDSATGMIGWTPAAVGDYEVVIETRNSAGVDSQSYSIHVSEIPVITTQPVTTAILGEPYTYDVEASGDPVPAYLLVTAPAGMTIDPVTGLIAWTPLALDDVDVTVQASNLAGSDNQSFAIHVTDTTRPAIAVTAPPPGGTFEGMPQLFVACSDNVGLDRGYYQIDGCDGTWLELWAYNSATDDTTIIWTVPPVAEGNHAVHFKVTDDTGNSNADTCDYSWTFRYERPCCVGLTGNVDGDPEDFIDIGDLTALVDYLFISFREIECMAEANIDGSTDGAVDIGDITWLIDYLFIDNTLPAPCR